MLLTKKIKYFDKPFIKEVFAKAFPLIIGTILLGLINLVDNFMINLFQEKNSFELSAASLANKYLQIIDVFVQATIALYSFLVFQYKGVNNILKVKNTIKIMILWMIIINIIAIIVAWTLANHVMHFFQGINFSKDLSTSNGLAQNYMKILIFALFPSSIFSVFLVGVNAYGKQKILIFITILSLLVNILFNYFFYKLCAFGLSGIAYSTILANAISLLFIMLYVWKKNIHKAFLFWPWLIFKIDKNLLFLSSKKILMFVQALFWSLISIGISIIYSNWYGDQANERLAIISPIVAIFYSALNGVATTKGYFIGRLIGQGNKKQAYINDKKINLYTFFTSLLEAFLLIIIAFLIPYTWNTVAKSITWDATYMLIIVALTYPIAGLSKTLLGSFKVAGMGKTIILSNGLFALFFEFLIPLILYLLNTFVIELHLSFLYLYLISRCIKLVKLPPTYYFWKKLGWLNKTI